MRALYQRKAGRDLFDLATALEQGGVDAGQIIDTFPAYMEHGGHEVTRPQFEENLQAKLENENFAADIRPLLTEGYEWDLQQMAKTVTDELIAKLPGDAR